MFGWCRGLFRRPGRTLAVLLLLPVIGLALVPAGGALWFRSHYRAAERAFHKREFVTAREQIDQCLRVFPRDPDARLLAARIARRAGAFDRAQEHLDVYANLVGSGQTLTLERLLLRAQQGDLPPLVEAQFRIWVDQGHPDSALILEVVSQHFMHTYRLSNALEALDRWLELEPDDLWALLRRGWVLERLNRYDEAMEDYERAVAVAPDVEGPRLRLAQALLYGKNDPRQAEQQFQAMYDRGERGSAILLGLAQCRWERSDAEGAQRILDDLLASHPRDPTVLSELGKIAIQLGRDAEAEPHLREAMRLEPTSYQAHYTLAECLEHLGRPSEAEAERKRADQIKEDVTRMQELMTKIQESPRDATVQCDIGRLFLRLGQPREGVAWLYRALDLDPFLRSAHEALADYFESVHDAAKVEEHRQFASRPRPPAGPPGR
jgi:tetratricopeptide (TPR) repeat protein